MEDCFAASEGVSEAAESCQTEMHRGDEDGDAPFSPWQEVKEERDVQGAIADQDGDPSVMLGARLFHHLKDGEVDCAGGDADDTNTEGESETENRLPDGNFETVRPVETSVSRGPRDGEEVHHQDVRDIDDLHQALKVVPRAAEVGKRLLWREDSVRELHLSCHEPVCPHVDEGDGEVEEVEADAGVVEGDDERKGGKVVGRDVHEATHHPRRGKDALEIAEAERYESEHEDLHGGNDSRFTLFRHRLGGDRVP